MISTEDGRLTERVRQGVTSATAFDDLDWACVLGTYESQGYSFVVRCTDEDLGTHIASLLRPLKSTATGQGSSPVHTYSVIEYPQDGGSAWAIYRDGIRLRHRSTPATVISIMQANINRKVIWAGVGTRVGLHASCVAKDGQGVIMAAPMESGKTTLATGLLRRGLDYLTDEATMVDPVSLTIHGYPKALTIDAGSWSLFPDLEPAGPAVDFTRDQWHVPLERLGSSRVSARAEPSILLAPRYSPDAETRLVAIPPSAMVKLLLESTFHFRRNVPRNLPVLARLVEQCRYYRLEVSDLEAACDLVLDLLEGE